MEGGEYSERMYTMDEVLGMLDGGKNEPIGDGSDDDFGMDMEGSSDSDKR